MKSTFAFILISLILIAGISSCGPSAKEKEAYRIADNTREADSMALVMAHQQRVADSTAKGSGDMNKLDLKTKAPTEKKFIKTAETKFLVGNVRKASDKIEDLAAKYSGYITFSRLQNAENFGSRINISKDSVLVCRQITVENHIELRIPNENIDSMVRELNTLILFLDYRIVKLDEVTFNILANQKATDRLAEYDSRQKKHIDTKPSKLKETTKAEENLLSAQMAADKLSVENMQLADKVKYCDLTIDIYQKPFNYRQVLVSNNVDSFRPSLFHRVLDALNDGWIVLEYFLVFLCQIWWLLLIGAVTSITIMVYQKRKRIKH